MLPALKPEETSKIIPTNENRILKLEREIEILKADFNAFKKINDKEEE